MKKISHTKQVYRRIFGMMQLHKDNVHMAEIKLKEERAALKSAEEILRMIERHYPEAAK